MRGLPEMRQSACRAPRWSSTGMPRGMQKIKAMPAFEQAALGIELVSTRIEAVLVNEDHRPLAQGKYAWENRLEYGVWTYPPTEV